MSAGMPRGYTRVYNREVWRAVARAWWDQRGRFLVVEVIVAAALTGLFLGTGYAAVGWSIAISVLALVSVGIVWLLRLGAVESARRDWSQVRAIEEARGDLTDEEIRQAQRDRKLLQRYAYELRRLLYPAMKEGDLSGLGGAERAQLIRDAIAKIQQTGIETDHLRGDAYYDMAVELEDAFDRTADEKFLGWDDLTRAFQKLVDLEEEDRVWVIQRRRFRPTPEDQPLTTAPAPTPPSSPESS